MPEQEKIRKMIAACIGENSRTAEVRYDEPMSAHTTFKVGGPADCWVRPLGEDFPAVAVALLGAACAGGVPVFILGGGANLVVADRGIRGIVLDTTGWKGLSPVVDHGGGAAGNAAEAVNAVGTANAADTTGGAVRLCFRSGTSIDEAAEIAAAAGLSGLEFLAGMPGSVGGAVWMNARCYEREIADALVETTIVDFLPGLPLRFPANRAAFGYKRSPFQNRPCLILSAAFSLTPRDKTEIRREMEAHRLDRTAKGHYRFPCAGSAFKNNRAFGKPTGKIIDELGLRGLQTGGAQVAPFHGNIIINAGGASAADIRALTEEVAARVKAATGFVLEPEILFAGDW
ncbi:UDP-N-acetylenolpyruvoylglucosamine reductase [Spirochaetia bacterium]|nr:UDP-N-acetylenolpyruvoylglucosamine reductase [Spirochaetia bacterium]